MLYHAFLGSVSPYRNLRLPFSLADSFAGIILRNNFSTRFENSVRNDGGHLSPGGDKYPEGAAAEAGGSEERCRRSRCGRRGAVVAGHVVSYGDFPARVSPERFKTFSALLLGCT